MQHWMLKALAESLGQFRKLTTIRRIGDTLFSLQFGKEHGYFFDMTRGESLVYPAVAFVETKRYQSPFDAQLSKRASGSQIEAVTLLNDDKLLAFDLVKQGSYKSQTCRLVFEFTGKHTNAVLLDEKGVILEAMRHIPSDVSTRPVQVGFPYTLPPPPTFAKKPAPDNMPPIDTLLAQAYQERTHHRLEEKKRLHIAKLHEQSKRLQQRLDSLEAAEALETKGEQTRKEADLMLANISRIRPYDTTVTLEGYDGESVTIRLAAAESVNRKINLHYAKARRLLSKAKNVHIEEENLRDKIAFLHKMAAATANAQDEATLTLLFPKRKIGEKKELQDDNVERFTIEGFPVWLGKNEKGNIWLLGNAKAGDMWMHLKDRPSAHVIIRTSKQQLPQSVLLEAAKLCATFSAPSKGDYPVDYTFRRNVKIKERAFVNYVEYKTLHVRI